MVQPRALTLMVTAGQWQAVKDTLSRPNGWSLTTSDILVFQQQVQPLLTYYSYRYNNLICYDTLIDTASYYVTTILDIIFQLIQHPTTDTTILR